MVEFKPVFRGQNVGLGMQYDSNCMFDVHGSD